jgi:hypothetical protein
MKPNSTLSVLLLLCLAAKTVHAGLPWAKKAQFSKAGLGTVKVSPPTRNEVIGTEGLPDTTGGMLPFRKWQDSTLVTLLKDASSQENTALVFGGAALAGGLTCAVAPGVALSVMGGTDVDKDSVSGLFCELIGSVDVGSAITIVSLMSGTAMPRAVGFGLLPRIVMVAKNLISGKFERQGCTKWKRIVTKLAIGSVVTTSLISGCGSPDTTIKVIAGVEMLVGAIANFKPSKLLKSTQIDIDTEDNRQAKAILKGLGQELFCHGVYIGCLASGCAPLNALGWYAASGTAVMAQTVASKDCFYEDLGFTKKSVAVMGAFAGAAALRLLQGEDEA